MLVRRDAAAVRLFTRNGHDWTGRFPLIARAALSLKAASCLIDGEAVACDHDGLPVFPDPAEHGTNRISRWITRRPPFRIPHASNGRIWTAAGTSERRRTRAPKAMRLAMLSGGAFCSAGYHRMPDART